MDLEEKKIKTIIKEIYTKTKDSRAYNIYSNRLNKKIKKMIRFRESRANPNSLIVLDMLKKTDKKNENKFKLIYKRIFKFNKDSSKKIIKVSK